MARLYSNENFPLPVVEKLHALGHDVLTIQETGKADQALPDGEVLKFAKNENRACSHSIAAISFDCIRTNRNTQKLSSAQWTRILSGKRSEFTQP